MRNILIARLKTWLSTESFFKLKNILILYVLSVVIKLIFIDNISTPLVYGDELIFAKVAEDFHNKGIFSDLYPMSSPLYSIVISNAYFFNDPLISYKVIKIINIIISSLIIFPAWLISKEFFNYREAFYLVVLVALTSINFTYPFTVMAENLFVPLFVLAIFLSLKSVSGESKTVDFFCGFVMGLCYLTKIIGIILPFTYAIVLLLYILYNIHNLNENKIKRLTPISIIKYTFKKIFEKFSIYLAFIMTIIPWIIRNIYLNDFSLIGIFGYESEFSGIKDSINLPLGLLLHELILQFILHLNYFILSINVVLSSFIVLFVITLNHQRIIENKKLFIYLLLSLVSLTILLLIDSYHTAIWNLVVIPNGFKYIRGRYLDQLIPIFIILSFIKIRMYNIKCFKKLIASILAVIISILIASPTGLVSPISSVGIIHITKFASSGFFTITLLSIPIFVILLKKYINFRNIAIISAILFLISSYYSYNFVFWASNAELSEDQFLLAKWINSIRANDKDLFIIETNESEPNDYLKNSLSFFTNARYEYGKISPNSNQDGDYYITSSPSNRSYLLNGSSIGKYILFSVNKTMINDLRRINIGSKGIHPDQFSFVLPTMPKEYLILEAENFSGLTSHESGWGRFGSGFDLYEPYSNGFVLSSATAPGDAVISKKFNSNFTNKYNIWIRSLSFSYSASRYYTNVDNIINESIFLDKSDRLKWSWQLVNNCSLIPGQHEISLTSWGNYSNEANGNWAGIDLILITNNLTYVPTNSFSFPQNTNPNGKPDKSPNSSTNAFYLWQDDQLEWHIRWNGSVNSTFSGTIISDDIIKNAVGYSLGLDDCYSISNNSIIFYSAPLGNEKGIDFLSEGEGLTFCLQERTGTQSDGKRNCL